MFRFRIVVASILVLALVTISGCSWIQTNATSGRLKGVWYESSTGLKYEFASDSKLILPTGAAGASSVSYQILDGKRLVFTQNGATQILDIKQLDSEELVTQDPRTGGEKTYLRDPDRTASAKDRAKVAAGALAAVRRFPAIKPRPDVVWLTTPPSGKVAPWPLWRTSDIARYATAWDWTDVKAAPYPVDVSGTGYAVVFERPIPKPEQLAVSSKGGQVVEPGGRYIDVGYSAAMARYEPGTFVYTGKGILVYSLGEGYVLGVRVGSTESVGFVPYTYWKR